MKRRFAVLAAALLCCIFLSSCSGSASGSDTVVLNVYNWGQYISDGSEGTLDVNAAFEEYYYETFGQRVRVNYTTYASNEDMYNKIKSGATSYDVIVPSDYMIQRMAEEGMLAALDFDNIPNYEYIEDEFKGLYFDPDEKYSVPYTYGMVGIIYNSTMVDREVSGWDVMWDPDYRGKILQFNNPRDAFGTAQYYLGIDVNTQDREEWHAAFEKLLEQKPYIQSYVMDEIFNKMKNGSAAIAPYYAGDFLSMYEDNDALEFVYPEEGTNIFIDSMCVPYNARHKDVAEAYINFMLSEEAAVANAEYIYYASPNRLVIENEEYIECMTDVHEDAMQILYPDSVDFEATYYYNLDADTLQYQNELWEQLKIESSIEPWIHVACAVIVAGIVVFFVARYIIRKKRSAAY